MADAARRLQVSGLVTGYGTKRVLNGVTVHVAPGETVALFGHNGAGKSTLLKAVFGLLPVWEGEIALDGQVLCRPRPRNLLRAGLVYVPQGNCVFSELSVLENLRMGGTSLTDRAEIGARVEAALGLFPALRPLLGRRAGSLSGGERQMLALATALILRPSLLLLDEPSLGLAPPVASETFRRIRQISRETGASVLIAEQKVRDVLEVTDRAYVLRRGEVTYAGPACSLGNLTLLREAFL